MPASDCLAKLGGQRFAASEDMLTAVMSAARGPAAISRTKRAVHLSLCAVPTLLMLVIGLLSVYNVGPRVANPHPHVRSVSAGEAADRAGVQADASRSSLFARVSCAVRGATQFQFVMRFSSAASPRALSAFHARDVRWPGAAARG
jgi:hypothetical protein